jgi:hypothetical protein
MLQEKEKNTLTTLGMADIISNYYIIISCNISVVTVKGSYKSWISAQQKYKTGIYDIVLLRSLLDRTTFLAMTVSSA